MEVLVKIYNKSFESTKLTEKLMSIYRWLFLCLVMAALVSCGTLSNRTIHKNMLVKTDKRALDIIIKRLDGRKNSAN